MTTSEDYDDLVLLIRNDFRNISAHAEQVVDKINNAEPSLEDLAKDAFHLKVFISVLYDIINEEMNGE